MSNSRKSWDYQKDKYKQVNIKFNMNDDYDSLIHHYLTCRTSNASRLIKDLLYEHIGKEEYLKP